MKMKITVNKKLDKRFATTEQLKRWFNKYTAAAGMWGFLIGALLSMYFSLEAKTPLLDPRGGSLVNKVSVNATTDKYQERGYKFCYDPLICIRDVGEELGISNKDILIAIKIAKAESGLRTDAINKNSNGTFDIGTFQINDVHGKRISREDRMDFEQNIRFAYKLRLEQGNWNAWSVCRSKVNCY